MTAAPMTVAATAPRATLLTQWTTPRRLRAFQIGIGVLALFLFLIGEGALSRARYVMKTIGKDAAPSIIAAEEIAASLADLDANAANYLLGTRQHQDIAARAYEKSRVQVTSRLVDVAENITYGDAEKKPIQLLFDGLGRYVELVAQARMLHDRGDGSGALATYRMATAGMHRQTIPSAYALDSANRVQMDYAYKQLVRMNRGAENLARVFGLLLVAALVWAQIFLLRRTRRTFNPALMMAAVLAVALTLLLSGRIVDATEDLRVAKEDAFQSVHVLLRARAIAYDANGDESRYLLDRDNAVSYENLFKRNEEELTSRPEITPRLEKDLASGSFVFKGLFAEELGNITFDGERDAASKMVRAYSRYHLIDQRIRGLENAGKHDDAIELCIGDRPDESNAIFAKFDEELGRVLQINRAALDAKVEEGDAGLKSAEGIAPVLAAIIAALGFFGIRPRLREYEA
jgi:hypothetical protein